MEYIGKSVERTDARLKVTGKQKYLIDQIEGDMLHGKILFSPHGCALINAIDTSEAAQVAGVFAIVTAKDLPQPIPLFGSDVQDYPLLAESRVSFYGQPVAVALAETEAQAQDAISKIKVKYTSLPAVTNAEEAYREGAPLVQPDRKDAQGNGCNHNRLDDVVHTWGNIEATRGKADYEIRSRYHFPASHHFPIEPFGVMALPDRYGGIIIRTPVQHPFVTRKVVSLCLNMPQSKIHVEPTTIGGGFGGKGYPKLEPLASYLALKFQRCIRIAVSVAEGFFLAKRLETTTYITTGYNCDGSILYQDIEAFTLLGAFSDAAPRVAVKGSLTASGPYRIPNVRVTLHRVYSNTMPTTAFRGFGMPQYTFATEGEINRIAEALGMDPVAVRMKNLPQRGELFNHMEHPADGEWREQLKMAVDWLNSVEKKADVGRGIAIGIKNGAGGVTSHAILKLLCDGSAVLSIGTTEMGQGAETVMKMYIAENLHVPMEKITVSMGDTNAAGFDVSTAGSRATVQMGRAVISACEDLLHQLKILACEIFGLDEKSIIIVDGFVIAGEKKYSYTDILRIAYGPGLGEIIAKGYDRLPRESGHPLGGRADYWLTNVIAVELKVDMDTGEITLLRCATFSDAGRIINPLMAYGQLIGGTVMSLGGAMMEHLIFAEDGSLMNGTPVDYRIPTAMDIPNALNAALIENEDGSGPYGSKGIGEGAVLAAAPAIAQAIYDATGVRINELPFTPEKVYTALQQAKEQAYND